MTMPPLPTAGDNAWRDDWAQAVHDAAEAVTEGRLTEEALRAAFGRRVVADVRDYGAVGDGVTDDTAAIQAAIDSGAGAVLFPRGSGSGYKVTAPLVFGSGTARVFLGSGTSSAIGINYSGSGFCFQGIATNPADVSTAITNITFSNLRIDGEGNTVSDGAITLDGAYKVIIDQCDIRAFAKAGAIGIRLASAFNVTIKHSAILQFTNGVGVDLAGASGDNQITNVQLWDFLIQQNAVGLRISCAKLAEGVHVFDGAFRMETAQIGVQVTGQVADLHFGPGLHVESYTPVATNTTTAFQALGAGLYGTVWSFNGIDFYNIKTLFDLDGSTGHLSNVTWDHLYATGLTGLAGQAYKLNKIQEHARRGVDRIDTVFYSAANSLTDTHFARGVDRLASTSLPTAANHKGRIVALTDTGALNTSRDGVRVSDGSEWLRFVLASASGVVRLPGDVVQWSTDQRIIIGTADPEGTVAGAALGSLYLRSNGTVYSKAYGGTGSTGWVPLARVFARPGAQLAAATDSVNTSHKYAGATAFDTTSNRPVWSTGASSTSPWVFADGTTAHTPA